MFPGQSTCCSTVFQRMFVLDVVPAWFSNRLKRMMKAASTVTTADARHLAWLRDELGDQFAAGIVFHAGPYVFPLGDRIIAAPIGSLWAGGGQGAGRVKA
jgi:hypothetical protein